MKINKPKLPLNSTPVRPRDIQSGYHSGQGLTPTRQQYENGMHMANLSPNKLNATKKPLAQKGFQTVPVQQVQQMPHIQLNQRRDSRTNRPLAMLSKRAVNQCANHPNKEGNYKILSDDEVLYYCEQCTTRVANQGFSLQKIVGPNQINVFGANPILSSRRQSYTNQAPVAFQPPPPPPQMDIDGIRLEISPEYSQEPKFLQLQDFFEECKQTLRSFEQNIEGFSKIQDHYVEQQQLVQQFYDAMIDYLKHIKGEHINLIHTEGRKYVQIAQIESAELSEDKENIVQIISDISENVQDIVNNVDEESFIQCMNQYRNSVQKHNHRVEEQRATFEEISKIEHEELEVKLQEFRMTVNDLFGVKESQSKLTKQLPRKANVPIARNLNNGMGMLNSNGINNNHNFGRSNTGIIGTNNGLYGTGATIPKANTNGPFRTLFGDDGTAQSPQFKNI